MAIYTLNIYNEVNTYSGEEIKKDEEQLNEKEVEESVKEARKVKKGKPSQREIDKVSRDTEDEYGGMARLRPSKYKIHKEEVKIVESDKQYRRYEGQNQHGKAAVYAWKKYHDKKNPKEVAHGKDLKAINKRHDERGHLSHNDGQSRYKISKTYTDRMHSKKEQVEIIVDFK